MLLNVSHHECVALAADASAGGSGKLSKRPGITWSDTPVAVTYSKPYAVAVLPGHIEVCCLPATCFSYTGMSILFWQ